MKQCKPTLSRVLRTALMMLMDAFLVNLSMILAQQLRFGVVIPDEFWVRYLNIIPELTVICLVSYWAFSLYRNMWKYASVDSVIQIVAATLVGAVGIYLYSLLRYTFTQPLNQHLLHKTVYLLFWLVSLLMIGGSRIALRIFLTRGSLSIHRGGDGKARRVMVVGAGWAGASLIREMQAGRYGKSLPVVAVDDDPSRVGSRIGGVHVVRGTDAIDRYAREYAVDDIIIAIATPKGELKPLVERCLATGCRVRRVTDLELLNQHEKAVTSLRDIDIGDLLGRAEEQLDMTQVARCFSGKTVLITGGGGSIGSELCRQLLPLRPEKIVLYDISENYMYDLFFELQEKYGMELKNRLILCVGSVQDPIRLGHVMDRYQPEILLHAAAHKHVPLMEDCPDQAAKNNILGTYCTAQAAIDHGVRRFCLISTDKAVNPTNVMGATKRMAEFIIEAMNTQGKTEFTAVRFGNVLGSHGSVVPLFERQIRAGGPVTLTHPDIIRYFMTIPEAAELVLQAASIAKGGELFVLDMGQPMRIKELAERMIQLYGTQDGKKVEIVYTGLRPGEKLYEELLMGGEGIAKTENEKIFVAQPEVLTMQRLNEMIAQVRLCLASSGDMRACLHELVPTFREPEDVNALAEKKRKAEQEQTVEAGA